MEYERSTKGKGWGGTSQVLIVVGALLLSLLVVDDANAFRGRRRCGGCYDTGYYFTPAYFPITVYQTSLDLEIDAAVEKKLRDLGITAAPPAAGYGGQQAPAGQPQLPGNVLQTKCAKCHNGESSQGGYAWDMSKVLSDSTFARITEMVGESIAIPDQMTTVMANLQPIEKASILKEIIVMRRAGMGGALAGDRPPPMPAPVESSPAPMPPVRVASPYTKV